MERRGLLRAQGPPSLAGLVPGEAEEEDELHQQQQQQHEEINEAENTSQTNIAEGLKKQQQKTN